MDCDLGAREEDSHRGAFADARLNPHASTRLLGKTIDLRQSEARVTDELGAGRREKRFPDLGQREAPNQGEVEMRHVRHLVGGDDRIDGLCQSNGRSSARGATRPPSSDIQAARARHSANVAERLCL